MAEAEDIRARLRLFQPAQPRLQRRRHRLFEPDRHAGIRPAVLPQRLERAVEQLFALVDHDRPRADLFDVGHVVRREQNRRAVGAVQRFQKCTDALLDDDVHADRRLVEDQHRRAVQDGGRQLAAHALAERKRPHRPVGELVELEHIAELHILLVVDVVRYLVHFLVQLQRRRDRQIPPELGFLPEDHADLPRVLLPIFVGHKPVDGQLAGRRRQDAAHHLDRRRLTRAVRPDVADDLAGADVKRDVVDRAKHLRRLRPPQLQPTGLFEGLVVLRQIAAMDHLSAFLLRFCSIAQLY